MTFLTFFGAAEKSRYAEKKSLLNKKYTGKYIKMLIVGLIILLLLLFVSFSSEAYWVRRRYPWRYRPYWGFPYGAYRRVYDPWPGTYYGPGPYYW